ncbi:MAG: GTPase ObgE [Candidatus Syntrophonatronum acetioxidans]|uniref:GTPase Obg n=1 Tax=Candidatus Syntrophonatronum acetioxidans TaxID=1795816 RepID=A0A424YG13_9FIRM|nr:MAG: GTPase ObgE [Candidatus Syntrophonatronum acetioxidans]
MFVDRAKVYVKGGDGGNGAVSFRREKYVSHGGPDGGDGGKGGDVVFEVDRGLRTLLDFKYRQHFKGGRGQHGQGKNRHGKGVPDLVVKVPPGTVIYDAEREEIIADLTEPGEKVVIARGGRGGRGNARFASPTRKAPRLVEKGEPGEERQVILELKLLAEVGLVGYPNSGKSTLLSRISAAKPKIASYPFTTLTPNLGQVQVAPGKSFVVADIPGIIEGAHQGVGLGLQFLRHIERTRVLLFILDAAETEGRDPLADFHSLQEELLQYSEKLKDKPGIIAANKVDLPRGKENLPRIKNELERQYPVFGISALTGEGVQELIYYISQSLDKIEEEELKEEKVPLQEEVKVYKPPEKEELEILFDGEVYQVKGKGIEKFVHMTDFDNEEAVDRLQRFFKRIKVEEALKKEGIQEGDTVRIGPMEFTYSEESFN